jgi:hypothetical protein
MSTIYHSRPIEGVLKHSAWDALLVSLAGLQAAALFALPAAPTVALGLWWNSNTIAHYFIHRPFFRPRSLNLLFSLYLSILLGIPQTLWRERHLAHHAGVPHRWRWSGQLAIECGAVALLWCILVLIAPLFFLYVYLPGYLAGLCLCSLHGHYEHADGTTSHHGRLYNLIFFNDGYHVEHHAHPGEHWTRLPFRAQTDIRISRWPAILRWLDFFSLDGLERLVLHSRWLQRFVIALHERAFRKLLADQQGIRRVLIVGGGLFPRTLLVLKRVLPDAEVTILDANAGHLESAKRYLDDVPTIEAWYGPEQAAGYDLVVFPLAFRGDREEIYRHPPAPLVIVHDWAWRRRGVGVLVSLLLLKRLNLVRP